MGAEKSESDLSSNEIYRLMSKARGLIAKPVAEPNDTVQIKTEILSAIEVFVKQISSNSAPAFIKMPTNVRYRENPNQPLCNSMQRINYFLNAYSSLYIFSPHVEVFFDCCWDMNILRYVDDNKFSVEAVLGIGTEKFRQYNELIDLIAIKLESNAFKITLNKRVQNSKKNYASLCLYEQGLFSSYETLMVLRLDFTYYDSQAQYMTLERAKKDLKRFKDNMRSKRRLFLHHVGYIWRLEFGERKGYYFRMIFFFDGLEVSDDVKLAEEIGEYWSKHINAESTVTINDQPVPIFRNFINYNKIAKGQNKDGMAILSRDDTKLRHEFRLYGLGYIAKADQFLMIKGKEGRSFGTGRL